MFLKSTYIKLIHSTTIKKFSQQRYISTRMSSNLYATVSYVTAPSEDVARELSKNLVTQKLAACVNIVKGVQSIYVWEGKIEESNESLLIIKSHSTKSNELIKFVQANHPYDCPEIITMKIDSGSEPYLKWIEASITNSVPKESLKEI